MTADGNGVLALLNLLCCS